MAQEVTIGGERLGSGKRMKAYLHEYERSTHDRSYLWRSTMAPGTLVPFMNEVALPGSTFDINLKMDGLTLPTIGPLFGTYKMEAHVFQIPIRLYNGKLHMNLLGTGLDMSKVKLPQVELKAESIDKAQTIDNQHINPSSIFSMLGIRGLGYNATATEVTRHFNAIPWLGYWDIYKNYYANKQEEIGVVIHKDVNPNAVTVITADLENATPEIDINVEGAPPWEFEFTQLNPTTRLVLSLNNMDANTSAQNIPVRITYDETAMPDGFEVNVRTIFQDFQYNVEDEILICSNPFAYMFGKLVGFANVRYDNTNANLEKNVEPKLVTFPLSNIDSMKKLLLSWSDDTSFIIDNDSENPNFLEPYILALQQHGNHPAIVYSKQFSQEGLAIKTFNSDLFNNWISTEWIDGEDGISAVTAIDTSSGSFTIDELNLSKKVYDMLNRIAISGGSYDDWLDAVYTHDRPRSRNPIYLGGLIQNIVFQEVISNSATAEQPLGTLAGRGVRGQKHQGGNIVVKINEPSFLLGIASITPNIDYSQGNKWDTNLRTMNDFHKPALDQIGFQDLITDQMAWWDTKSNRARNTSNKSAGKQPAWVNYMTNVNLVRGNFAEQNQEMFMVLNRRYSPKYEAANEMTIRDLTTYIDPVKFNHIFANTRRDSQNFWIQMGVNIEARLKMSAKIMPNL